ncbi:hypothetical protein [Alteromonas macleodii]|uniref:hypothetical protein n=1 Tax=Alteromonas macleodii TaxID=28108 RepID=UPI0031405B1F|tara:strand:- start:439 stop:990 length:552 start_codon:yes stop_codon:yes gene_type:complete
MKPLTRKNFNIVARLFVAYSHTHPQMGVNFSVTHKGIASSETPRFVGSYDLKPEVYALTQVESVAQTDINNFMNEQQYFYGYDNIMSSERSLKAYEVHALSKAIKGIEKKMTKLIDEKGHVGSFQEYLERLFEAVGVDEIWFETLSEKKQKSRYTSYDVEDLPTLINEGYQLLVTQNGWLKAS